MLNRFNDAQINLTELTLGSAKEALVIINQTDDSREDMDSKLGETMEQL